MRSQSSKRSYTNARERADQQNTSFSATYLKIPEKAQMFKPKAGSVTLDILPFTAGENNPWAQEGNLHWERTYYTHRGIGAGSDAYICPRKNSDSPCPICEYRAKLMKMDDSSKEDLIKDLAPKQRQLFNVINLKEPEKGVQLWDISYHLFGKALDARLRNSDEEDEWDSFFHLEGGKSLKIGFAEETGGGYNFLKTESIDFKPRKEDYDDDTLDKVFALDEILLELEYDELKKVFLQTGDDKAKKKVAAEDEEEELAPKKKRVVEEEEEEEDPAPKKKKPVAEEEDEEEEPAPKKKRVVEEDEEPAPKKKKAAAEEEDNWEDFDEPPKKSKKAAAEEEDEEEEPAPKKKRVVEEEEEEEPAPKRRK